MALRADPEGIAPERLLVFDLTGSVQNFVRAAANVPGLEFVAAEDAEPSDVDKAPAFYLLVPNAAALEQMVGLWRTFAGGRSLPYGFAPWRDLFAQLRDLRPWGPQDRLTETDAEILAQERADADGMIRIELELVFRPEAAGIEAEARVAVEQAEGRILSRARFEGPRYHALLVETPAAEITRILQKGRVGLVASEAVMHIRPQSAVRLDLIESGGDIAPPLADAPTLEPIAAIFDAAPLASHPKLDGRLSILDPFDLEPKAVGVRAHGTAMASGVVHGDLAATPLPALDRRVLFVNVMYAPPAIDGEERFPDRLPADLFHQAVTRLREQGEGAQVVVVNASLGDSNKPFTGRLSGWARVVDYLAYEHGLLFVVSAGNHLADLATTGVDILAFEALPDPERARVALRAVAAQMAQRRVLAPAEAVNVLTVGALHADAGPVRPPQASVFDVWADTGLSSVSSALGPGLGNSVKPDVLAPGGRHHVRLMPSAEGHLLRPLGRNAGFAAGVTVAAPAGPAAADPDQTARTIGTSIAAALMTGLAARVHETLEAVYDDFGGLPRAQRAALLKAMLVHSARWTAARDLIREVLGPADGRLHVQQRDNVRRFLGFGAVDGEQVLACTQDRATLWTTGRLGRDQAHSFTVPLPTIMSGQARLHEVSATLAWFAPPRLAASYRGIRLAITEPKASAAAFAVSAAAEQPDFNQVHRGTVCHRRWAGDRAAVLGEGSAFEISIQRQPDELDEWAPYGFVVSVAMPGLVGVYTAVRDRLAVQPRVGVVA